MLYKNLIKKITVTLMGIILLSSLLVPVQVNAASSCTDENNTTVPGPCCGQGASVTQTSIEFGCGGKGNGITDLTFAIIRFLTNGVGIVIVASMIYAGIQYTSSRGDPGATGKAIARIRSNVFAILLFAFAYALLNFVIPGQVLK